MATPFLEHPVLLRIRRMLVTLVLLVVLGAILRPIEAPSWRVVKASQPELNLEAIEGSLGQGLVIGVLGGFRTIMADFAWIRMDTVWQRRDRAELDAMIRLVTTLDPRPDFFWINSARMVAYDVPNWRIEDEGGYSDVSAARQLAINQEQAGQAFALLARAREFHSDSSKLTLETGQIHLNRLKDIPKAAEWFLKASKMPDAPYFAARIYAELLRNQGKDREAYDYLKQLYIDLPDDPYAQKDIVLERIRNLEDALKVSYLLRFNVGFLAPAINTTEPAFQYNQPQSHGDGDDDSHDYHNKR